MTSLALELLRVEYIFLAPKGEAMGRATFATAFGHPLGPQKRLTSMFVPYHRIWLPISFDLAFVRDFASFAQSEWHFTDQAPKGKAIARVTLATAFGHPLRPQQRLTSALAP